MSVFASPRFLRFVMLADAASVLVSGVPQVAVTEWLARWTGLPAQLLMASGLFLLVYGVFASWIGTRSPIPAAPVWLVVMGNSAWGVACGGLIGAGIFNLTAWGLGYLVLNVVAVTVFAGLQWVGLRHLPQSGRLTAA